MKYTKKQLIDAQLKYDNEYLKNPDDFFSNVSGNIGDAKKTINYLLSLVEH